MRARFALTDPGPSGAVVRKHRVRVGYVDTDKAGVVHHTVYLVWLEQARIEYLRAGGLDYRAFERETQLALPVVEARMRYRSPARFDDQLDIETWVSISTRAKVVFESRIRRSGPGTEAQGEILCEGIVECACVDMQAERACSMHESVRRACAGPR